MSNILNTSPYLRTSWEFPTDAVQLSTEVSRSYIATAQNVNLRTIGIFPKNRPAIGGESWFFSSSRQQNLRQIYTFTTPNAFPFNIPHNLDWASVFQISKCQGFFTDNTNWYGILFGSNIAIAGQISFYVTNTNIVLLSGAGAPVIANGTIVLEWISQI